jgi:phage shock protein B
MEFWKFMFVPTILFLVVVAPMWLTMHYRSVNRASRGLTREDRDTVEHMLVTVDKMADRISALESILDTEHKDWRSQVDRQGREQRPKGE